MMTHEKKILMVVTSHNQIDENHPTGLWLEQDGHLITGQNPQSSASIAQAVITAIDLSNMQPV